MYWYSTKLQLAEGSTPPTHSYDLVSVNNGQLYAVLQTHDYTIAKAGTPDLSAADQNGTWPSSTNHNHARQGNPQEFFSEKGSLSLMMTWGADNTVHKLCCLCMVWCGQLKRLADNLEMFPGCPSDNQTKILMSRPDCVCSPCHFPFFHAEVYSCKSQKKHML